MIICSDKSNLRGRVYFDLQFQKDRVHHNEIDKAVGREAMGEKQESGWSYCIQRQKEDNGRKVKVAYYNPKAFHPIGLKGELSQMASPIGENHSNLNL